MSKRAVADPSKMSLSEAAQVLRVNYQQAWNLVLTGVLAGKKVGAFWMVERESVERRKKEAGGS